MGRCRKWFAAGCFAFLFSAAAMNAQADVVRVIGATTAGLPVKDATDDLKDSLSITLQFGLGISSSIEKIYALGSNQADVVLLVRHLTAADTASFPEITFNEIPFGEEAAVLVVSHDVWDAGVRSITKEQARGIYEGKIKNWKEIGGPDLLITGYMPQQGHGIWACYIEWIYENPNLMKENRFAEVSGDEEARSYLEATQGAIVPVSMLYAQSKGMHALAIKDASSGKEIDPTPAAVGNHTYAMVRPLIFVVKGRPLGDIKLFLNYMLGDKGQALVHKYNYLTLKELGITPQVY